MCNIFHRQQLTVWSGVIVCDGWGKVNEVVLWIGVFIRSIDVQCVWKLSVGGAASLSVLFGCERFPD
ncbi:hypothetical protein B2J88_48290 [Rhodococcus sp. SRB_17]|nr:hypothetical protein [Rhodococcus sp. SRB_17]